MTKNIVFDMGKVLTQYDSGRICRKLMADPDLRHKVQSAVFFSPEWIFLDMGVIPEPEALALMTGRLHTPREKALAEECFAQWHEHCMWPIEDMADVVARCKERGFGLYVCSNASLRLLTCYTKVIPAIELFDGVLFSAEVKAIKPQREMYGRFFERFSLNPAECFFIDDLESNVRGSIACGMDAWHHDGDVEKLRRKLETL
ncbi:MAG: HAD family phosphatase [Lachnospiraceae bacterium]|nr:HAD family phosphatase [Lachnospiraceae bacterium]